MLHLMRHGKINFPISLVLLSAAMIITFTAVPVFSQMTAADIEALRERGKQEGWTFSVSLNPATQRPLKDLCGVVEPPNWRASARFDLCTSTRDLPDSFDWRDYDGCTSVKAQGDCGSCWAFSTVGPLECLIKIKDSIEMDLSEQWLVSCNQEGYSCENGGWLVHDYHWWKTDACGGTGAVLEEDFPYEEADVPCECPYPHEYKINNWAFVGPQWGTPTIDQLKQAIYEYGPISSIVTANDAMQAYGSGIFNGCEHGDLNHAVVLVGWDDNQGDSGIWIMRNSWGPQWGEDGYMRMPYSCSRIGYGAAYVYYQPIKVTAQDELGPSPMTVDFRAAAPWEQIDSCKWIFGDGNTGTGETPSNFYQDPGHFTVETSIYTPHGRFDRTYDHMISAYADTLQIEDASGEAGPCKVDVYLHNYLELKEITLPFSWAGPMTLVFDSFSTAGLPTEYFEDQRILNYDVFSKRAVVFLNCSNTESQPYLETGNTAVVSLWFTASGVVAKGSNPIVFTSYASFEPILCTYQGEYPPVCHDGSLIFGCCIGDRGNIQLEPICNDQEQGVDIADLTNLIDHLFINYTPICCPEEADIAPFPITDGVVDIADLTQLIDHLFINYTPLLPCP